MDSSQRVSWRLSPPLSYNFFFFSPLFSNVRLERSSFFYISTFSLSLEFSYAFTTSCQHGPPSPRVSGVVGVWSWRWFNASYIKKNTRRGWGASLHAGSRLHLFFLSGFLKKKKLIGRSGSGSINSAGVYNTHRHPRQQTTPPPPSSSSSSYYQEENIQIKSWSLLFFPFLSFLCVCVCVFL
jgi:hypothetical protein